MNQTGLKSRIWVSEGMDYIFPEQQLPEVESKPSIALCFSGGGARAMTAAMGQLRALHHLGVLDKCRYLLIQIRLYRQTLALDQNRVATLIFRLYLDIVILLGKDGPKIMIFP